MSHRTQRGRGKAQVGAPVESQTESFLEASKLCRDTALLLEERHHMQHIGEKVAAGKHAYALENDAA